MSLFGALKLFSLIFPRELSLQKKSLTVTWTKSVSSSFHTHTHTWLSSHKTLKYRTHVCVCWAAIEAPRRASIFFSRENFYENFTKTFFSSFLVELSSYRRRFFLLSLYIHCQCHHKIVFLLNYKLEYIESYIYGFRCRPVSVPLFLEKYFPRHLNVS